MLKCIARFLWGDVGTKSDSWEYADNVRAPSSFLASKEFIGATPCQIFRMNTLTGSRAVLGAPKMAWRFPRRSCTFYRN
jgi:hypothetical protein